MNEMAITDYIMSNFEGIQLTKADGNTFFMYDPAQKFPVATIVTNDDYEQVSNLNRPGVFRLNIGISKATFQSLFGSQLLPHTLEEMVASGYDFTALNQLLPHPVYGRMYWVCILNPEKAMFEEKIKPLLAEAYSMATSKYGQRLPQE